MGTSALELGVHLPNSGALTDDTDLVDLAVRAEAAGFEAVWVYDHIFTPLAIESEYPRDDGVYVNQAGWSYVDALTTLAVTAGATSTIRLGTRVLVPVYRNPVVLAKQLSSLSRLSGGRLRLGVGAGWMGEEFAVVGVPIEERYARLEEHVALMRQAWADGISEFDGRFYSHPPGGFFPRPASPIPVLVGGFGDATLRRVARWGDGWAAVPDPAADDPVDDIAARVRRLHQLCEDRGRDPRELVVVAGADMDCGVEHLDRLATAGVTAVDLIATNPGHVDLGEAIALRDAWLTETL